MADHTPEKSVSDSQVETGDLTKDLSAHEARVIDQQGYIVDIEGGVAARDLKLAEDGHTVLIPQPSDDPKDPLNWSPAKKTLVLLVVSWASLLADYGSATGSVTLLPQSKIWHMSPDEVNHSQAGNVFMLGPGGVVAVALMAYFGRLPVLFWYLVIAFATAAWCAGATSFESFMAARILNGFFSTVAQGGGLYFVNDMYFFNQRARKINIWAGFVILSPYLGPLFAAFITSTQPWSIAFWVYTAMTGLALILTVLFVPETYYNRHAHLESRPSNGSRIATLIGLHQRKVNLMEPNTFKDAVLRPIKVFVKPTVFLSVLYYCLTFAWVVGINTTLSIFLQPLYGFEALQIGYFYFTPIVAVLLGEMFGHWLHDAIARQYIHKHKGHFEPEVRLRAIFVAIPCMVAGLVALGFCLDRGWHYMTTSVCWGLYVFGVMIATVALNAYNVDSYPEGSGEVAAWLNEARILGGFIISYFQVKWADSMGADKSFSIQGAIVAAAFVIVLILLKWGARMRDWSGPLKFKTI